MARSAVAKKHPAQPGPPEVPRILDRLEMTPVRMPFQTPPTVFVPYDQIHPVAYNPRTITQRQLDALKAGIKAYGLVEPLVLQKKGMAIIGGHQRYRAVREVCLEMGMEVPLLPCVILDVDNREAKRLNIALNKVSGDWDEELLGRILTDIHEASPIVTEDVLILGYDKPSEIGSLIGGDVGLSMGWDPTAEETARSTGTPSMTLQFSSKEERNAVKALIASKTPKKKKDEPSGTTLARMLRVRAE